MARFYTIIVFWIAVICAQAQELEYKMEFGAMTGTGFYMGDANLNGFYKNNTATSALMARYNLNPRMALKFDLGFGKIKGNAAKEANKFPADANIKSEFNNSLYELGCQYEANFFGYGVGGGFKGHKRFSPYIQFGLGFAVCNKELAMSIPFGFGVKYKVKPRVNVGIDWSMRFAMSDKLDGIEDPYKIQSGFLKNKDSYCWTVVYVSYDLFPKYRKCNND